MRRRRSPARDELQLWPTIHVCHSCPVVVVRVKSKSTCCHPTILHVPSAPVSLHRSIKITAAMRSMRLRPRAPTHMMQHTCPASAKALQQLVAGVTQSLDTHGDRTVASTDRGWCHLALPGMHASRDCEEAGLRGAESDGRGAIKSGTQISQVGVKDRAGEA